MFDGGLGVDAVSAGDPLADVWADLPASDEPSWLTDYSLNDELDLFTGSPRDRLDAVLRRRPCGLTMTALEQVAQLPMDDADKVSFAKAWQRQADAAQGSATAALADAVGEAPTDNEPDLMAQECALALRLSPDEAREQMRFARKCARDMSATLERWSAGAATVRHVRAVDTTTLGLTSEQVRRIDQKVGAKCDQVSVPWLRRLLNRAVAAIDCRKAEDLQDQAKACRGVFLERERGGTAVVGMRLPAVDAIAAKQALKARADAARFPGDTRTHAQREADVLLELLLGSPIIGNGVVRRRYRADIRVGITLAALLGLRDDPAYLEGYGVIPADAVRELLANDNATLRRMVIDPIDGRLLDYGRTRYKPGPELTERQRAKERSCRFPQCTRPGEFCDLDHMHEYPDGETSERNCHLLCRSHHRLKTFTRHRYEYDAETGEITWTTPLGFTYRTPPATYPEFLDPSPDDDT